MKYPDPILVLGVGRCGTSAVAGLLQIAGVFMGDEMTKPQYGNPKGYFEDIEFVFAHRGRVRREGELRWEEVPVGSPKWGRAIGKMLDYRRSLGIPWGFKDPAVCHHLHYWLRDYFVRPKMIWIQRNLFDCAKSLMIYGQHRHPDTIPDNKTYRRESTKFLRDRYVQYKKFVEGRNVLIIQFKDLIFDRTEEVIDEIIDYIEVKVNKAKRQEMSQFIEYPDRTKHFEWLKTLKVNQK